MAQLAMLSQGDIVLVPFSFTDEDSSKLEAAALAFATHATGDAKRATTTTAMTSLMPPLPPLPPPVFTGRPAAGAAAAGNKIARRQPQHLPQQQQLDLPSPSPFVLAQGIDVAGYHAAAAAGVVVVPAAVVREATTTAATTTNAGPVLPLPPVSFSPSPLPPPPQMQPQQPQQQPLAPVKCTSSGSPLQGVVLSAVANAANATATTSNNAPVQLFPQPPSSISPFGSGGNSPFAGFASMPMTPIDGVDFAGATF